MEEFTSIGRCHGATVEGIRASDVSEDEFRKDLIGVVTSARPPILVSTFSRAPLGQTGDGHYSPIAGYDAETDHVLVLDVARFKYPPWCALRWDRVVEMDQHTVPGRIG